MSRASNTRAAVCDAYSAAAERPLDEHPFPVGHDFAVSLGYPVALLAELPSVAVEAFAGVSNVSIFAELPPGARVLDLGCGAGLDSLIAARRVGPAGRVVGIDFSESMLTRARQAATEARTGNATFQRGDAENLPFASESFDVAIVNGIFNLNPSRDRIFPELFRVLRHGGSVFAAELILAEPLSAEERASASNWFA